jgi:hypothetical protein
MSFDDLRRNWNDEVNQPMIPTDWQPLLKDVQDRCAQLERVIQGRDLREILAALFVVAALGTAWPLLQTSRVAVAGFFVIAAGAGLITFKLLRARQGPSLPFHASVLEFARHRLAWLDGQIRLLQTVAWWYVGPLIVGCLMIGWGLAGFNPLAFSALALLDLTIAAGVIALNRHAVRTQLQPVRDEVARLIDALSEPPAA